MLVMAGSSQFSAIVNHIVAIVNYLLTGHGV
jgi:hypothetical protein